MGYMVFLLVLFILVLGGLILARSGFSKRAKILSGVLLLALALLIGIYNLLQDKEGEELGAIKNAFKQGEKIRCRFENGEQVITQEEFNLINGTMSFLGKPNTRLSGIAIPLQSCYVESKP